jgi:transcriptional regulator with XRE-family HTH domain
MARAGLNWSVNDLANQSDVAARTIARFEAGESVTLEKVEALRRALVDGGALLVDVEGRPGVAVRVPS